MSLKRKSPPTVEEVRACAWWWNFPPDGYSPHVLQLEVYAGYVSNDDIIMCLDLAAPFNVEDWPGEWAPCIPPT